MKPLASLLAFTAAVLTVALVTLAPAFADTTVTATTSTVTVPYGSWLVAVLPWIDGILGTILLGVLTWAAKFLPAVLRGYVNTNTIDAAEQLLERAIDYGINKVEGAAAGKTLSVGVGSAVLAEAAQYAIDHGPAKLIDWLGGAAAIKEKLLARLPLAPEADGAQVLANTPTPAT